MKKARFILREELWGITTFRVKRRKTYQQWRPNLNSQGCQGRTKRAFALD